MPQLLLLTGPSAGLRYDVKHEAVLGRSPSCEIPLEDGKVSRRHARVFISEGLTKISDLGSRNGTQVNEEKIDGEAILLPGDRFQIGTTTVLFDPPTQAALKEKHDGELRSMPVEEALPHVGRDAAIYTAGISLMSASSEAMVLRRVLEELLRSLAADKATALLGGPEGLITATVAGAARVEVPRALAQKAMEGKEIARSAGALCVPLFASGGMPFGVLYVERDKDFGDPDAKLAAMLARLAGEAFSNVRSQSDALGTPLTLFGNSRPFKKILEQARRSAAVSGPVVLWGEKGTGKRSFARYIHARSARALGPLVFVDCADRAERVEEALFGRQSGPGIPPTTSALLRADGGTLVLLHVESLPRHAGERLGRYLSRKVGPARQGGEEPVDVRLVATASAKLGALASRGELEPAIVKAFDGVEIEVVPLRERKADVAVIFENMTGGGKAPAHPERAVRLTAEARRMLTDYPWPGNVTELKLTADRLHALYSGDEVTALRLPPELQEGESKTATRTLSEKVARLERDAIVEALRAAKGKKIRAAAILGISRPTLDKKIEDFGLSVDKERTTS